MIGAEVHLHLLCLPQRRGVGEGELSGMRGWVQESLHDHSPPWTSPIDTQRQCLLTSMGLTFPEFSILLRPVLPQASPQARETGRGL